MVESRVLVIFKFPSYCVALTKRRIGAVKSRSIKTWYNDEQRVRTRTIYRRIIFARERELENTCTQKFVILRHYRRIPLDTNVIVIGSRGVRTRSRGAAFDRLRAHGTRVQNDRSRWVDPAPRPQYASSYSIGPASNLQQTRRGEMVNSRANQHPQRAFSPCPAYCLPPWASAPRCRRSRAPRSPSSKQAGTQAREGGDGAEGKRN